MKLAVVLFNLGGPDSPEAVVPFLTNLFSDPLVISAPGFIRIPLAKFIATRRGPVAREIYAKIGGRSPIVPETEVQAKALEAALCEHDTRVFIAMRHWKPFSDEAAKKVAAFAPDHIIALPLYPQFSTTTSQSSLLEWKRAAKAAGITAPISEVCCYPDEPGFISGLADRVRKTLALAKPEISYRLLLSAHGLPKKVVKSGDPYQWQVEQTAAALIGELGKVDYTICYQSRVGPLEWIGPSTDAEIRRAGAEGKGVIVVPVAFVSEHSETLVELDIEYAKLAAESGVADYLRVPTVSADPAFIGGLAGLVRDALAGTKPKKRCGAEWCRCGFPAA
ncbi:ferrochelatase [Rhizomicrobium palustre]|uniref:Ferrochelatase n=1 Tax=Rhizomicrobium palustre TaxID=189966 RepID=A0A846MYK6_9PROT|nr:ferrochelatase [Rhizomicrobium palustre]NIK88181.1 ferrochelatase [Rhizomicrobium palustre]